MVDGPNPVVIQGLQSMAFGLGFWVVEKPCGQGNLNGMYRKYNHFHSCLLQTEYVLERKVCCGLMCILMCLC